MPAKRKTNLTKKVVESLKVGEVTWDTQIPGLAVRRQANRPSFILKCTFNGKQCYITLGRFGPNFKVEDARRAALIRLGEATAGNDPRKRTKFEQVNVRQLCEHYIREHAEPFKKARSAHSDKRLIHNHILPLLGKMPVKDVKRSDVERFRDDVKNGKTASANPILSRLANRGGKIVTGGPGVANRAVALLSKIFNLAEEWELRPLDSNPARRIRKFKEFRTERYLSQIELANLHRSLNVAENSAPFAVAAIRLLLFTGARLGEIISLQWKHVDLERKIIWLPDSKTGEKPIRLSNYAIGILANLPRWESNPHVLPGHGRKGHLVNLQKFWKRLCANAGIENCRIHDLRHTFASIGTQANLPLQVIGSLLGHKSTTTTERYAHLRSDFISEGNEQIGSLLQKMMTE